MVQSLNGMVLSVQTERYNGLRVHIWLLWANGKNQVLQNSWSPVVTIQKERLVCSYTHE